MSAPVDRGGQPVVESGFAVSSDGCRIHYRVQGEGLLWVVFMHGWASTAHYWSQTIAQMNLAGMRAVTLDLRGHGDSDVTAAGFTFEQFSRDVLAVANAVGAKKFVVVGHSMGAKFVQHVRLLEPERVCGQILVAGCSAGVVDFDRAELDQWPRWEGNTEKFLQNHRDNTTRRVPASVANEWAERASHIRQHVLAETLRMCFSESFARELGSAGAPPPTLVVGALGDPYFSPAHLSDDVVGATPGSRLVTLRCGHEIPLEQPRELARLIEAFLAGLGARP